MPNRSNAVPLEDLPVELRRQLPYDHPALDDYAARVEAAQGLIPGLLRALKNAGERSNSLDVSSAGARGVMQFMPATAKRFELQDPTDPLASLDAAGRYVKQLSARFGDDPQKIAAAYNAGENNSGFANGLVPPAALGYAKRVTDDLKTYRPASAAVPLSDLPPELRRTTAPPPPSEAPLNITDVPGRLQLYNPMQLANPAAKNLDLGVDLPPWLSNALAGLAKSGYDTGRGAAQIATELYNPRSLSDIVTGSSPRERVQREIDEAARLDAPLMNTPSGVLGNVTGQIGQLALMGGAPVGTGLRAIVPAAVQAATFNALQPVTSDETRGWNAAQGALLGGAGQTAIEGVKALARPAGELAKPAIQALWAKAQKLGIPITTAQLSDSQVVKYLNSMLQALPFSGARDLSDAQRSAFTANLAAQMGESTDDLTKALQQARDRLGSTYDDIFARNNAQFDPTHADALVDAVRNYAPFDLSPNKSTTQGLLGQVDNIVGELDQNNQMPGDLYKALRSKLGKAAVSTTDANLADAYRGMQGALDDAMRNGITSPDDLAALQLADKQWGVMRTLEKLAPRDASGQPQFNKLSQVMAAPGPANAANRNAFVYGVGDQTLPDLARIEKQFLGDTAVNASAGVAPVTSRLRQAALGLGELGAAGGGLYALNASDGSPHPVLDTAADLGGLLIASRGLGSALNSQWFARGLPWLSDLAAGAERSYAAQLPNAIINATQQGVGQPADQPDYVIDVAGTSRDQ